MSARMLQGYTVLEFGQGIAAPLCAQILADLGADVIKLELAPGGDRLREIGVKPTRPAPGHEHNTSFYAAFNRSKRSLAIDINSDAGKAAIEALIRQVDVVIENFSPGVMAARGWSYERLRSLNPRLIMVSSSALGQTGPLANVKGYDWIGQAYAGLMNGVGEPDRPPALTAAGIGDVSTALANAMGIAVALLHRERTGEGQFLEASLLDTYMQMNEANVIHASLRNDDAVGRRAGSVHPAGPATGVYPCSDGGFVAITTPPHHWPAFTRVLAQPGLADDPRFVGHEERTRNAPELRAIIAAWFASVTRDDAVAALQKAGVASAPVLSVLEAIHHPHMIERGTVEWIDDPDLGRVAAAGPPVKFSAWPAPQRGGAPSLGEGNRDLLKRLANLDDAQIDALERAGVLAGGRLSEPA